MSQKKVVIEKWSEFQALQNGEKLFETMEFEKFQFAAIIIHFIIYLQYILVGKIVF